MIKQDNTIGLYALIAMCVGSMIGAGLFALPQNVADKAGVVALLIAWVITFLGMISLVGVFQNLSMRCPNLDAGIYAYAKEGFGDYLGFNSAWGYWVSAWLGNISYVTMLGVALSVFFPCFGDGTSWSALILSSTVIWVVTFLCLRGIKSASLVNVVATVTKIIPIVVFIVITAYAFDVRVFTQDIWQTSTLGSIENQIKNMMLITVWVFVGIEGASVFSARAKNRRDVGKATIISFLVMFFILFAVSVLPFGVLTQTQLAGFKNLSIGVVLAQITGEWGSILMNLGLVISVLGALLSWVLISAEVPFIAGKKDGLFPQIFTRENKNNFPAGSLIITAICQQSYLIIAHFYHSGYLATILLATAMILLPYLFSAIYALTLVISGKTYAAATKKERLQDFMISVVAIVYGVWLLYSAGKYLLLSSILYFVGSVMFIINRIIKKQRIFNRQELIWFLIIGVLGVISVGSLVTGKITL